MQKLRNNTDAIKNILARNKSIIVKTLKIVFNVIKKILKKAWRAIAILQSIFFIILFVSLFMEQDYSTKGKIIINKPVAEVFEYVRMLRNQCEFSYLWRTVDDATHIIKECYGGVDGEVGFWWETKIPNFGIVEKEITYISENQRMDYTIQFNTLEIVAHAYFITRSVSENQTELVWKIAGRVDYPKNILLWFIDLDAFDEITEEELITLKEILEEK